MSGCSSGAVAASNFMTVELNAHVSAVLSRRRGIRTARTYRHDTESRRFPFVNGGCARALRQTPLRQTPFDNLSDEHHSFSLADAKAVQSAAGAREADHPNRARFCRPPGQPERVGYRGWDSFSSDARRLLGLQALLGGSRHAARHRPTRASTSKINRAEASSRSLRGQNVLGKFKAAHGRGGAQAHGPSAAWSPRRRIAILLPLCANAA